MNRKGNSAPLPLKNIPKVSLKQKALSRPSKSDLKYDKFVLAAEYIYIALQDPKCVELQTELSKLGVLDHVNSRIDVKVLDSVFNTKGITVDQIFLEPGSEVKKIQGGAPITQKACILIVIAVLITTLTVFILTILSEQKQYENNCVNYDDLFKPKSFMNSLYKVTQLTMNPELKTMCKKIEEKRIARVNNLINPLNSLTSSFTSSLTTIAMIPTFLILLFSKGMKEILCMAAKKLDLQKLCDLNCGPNIKASNKKPTPESSPEEDEDE